MPRALRAFLIFAVAVFSVAPAAAIDGEVLLTQAKALNGGITPGDTPGYPITLSRPGTYKLAGNLSASARKNGIQVTTHDVTIDFAGFRLHGGAVANNAIVSSQNSLTIKGGMISLFRFNGIQGTGPFWIIDDMRVVFNGEDGISGRDAARQWMITNSQVVENGRQGILILGAANRALVQDNVVNGNGGIGIFVEHGHVEGNMVSGNGHAPDSFGSGVSVFDGSVVGNTITDNNSYGLAGRLDVGYGNNTFAGNNNGGAQVIDARPMQPNLCNGAAC